MGFPSLCVRCPFPHRLPIAGVLCLGAIVLWLGTPSSFLRRKGWADFLFAVDPAAHATRSKPPCSMPTIRGPRSGHMTGLPLRPHSHLARWSRIVLNAGGQLLMSPPSHEQPPHMSGEPPVVPNSQSMEPVRTAQAQPCPPQKSLKRRDSLHSEAPQPAPPRASHPALHAPRSGPQSHPAPTVHLLQPLKSQ